jgi:hypothetical protein
MISIIKTSPYEEMGSQTGFKYITRTCDNLVVGKWYELKLQPKFGYYELVEEVEVTKDK